MPRKESPLDLPEGRPLIPIDWDKVDEWLESGCKGTEIAPRLGVSTDTLYNRTASEKRVSFSEYAHEKKSKGDGILRHTQFKSAIKGNITMQIWLGKQRLDQKENPGMVSVPAEYAEVFVQTMNAIKQRQDALKIDDNIISSD